MSIECAEAVVEWGWSKRTVFCSEERSVCLLSSSVMFSTVGPSSTPSIGDGGHGQVSNSIGL